MTKEESLWKIQSIIANLREAALDLETMSTGEFVDFDETSEIVPNNLEEGVEFIGKMRIKNNHFLLLFFKDKQIYSKFLAE